MSQWWAKGLLFENCNCTAVCPGHVHFSQPCTHEVCHGFWALEFSEGVVDGTDLTGVKMVIIYVSPQTMIHGDWTQLILVDDGATDDQFRVSVDLIKGVYGPPWEILSGFVSNHLDPRRTRPTPARAARWRSASTSPRGSKRSCKS